MERFCVIVAHIGRSLLSPRNTQTYKRFTQTCTSHIYQPLIYLSFFLSMYLSTAVHPSQIYTLVLDMKRYDVWSLIALLNHCEIEKAQQNKRSSRFLHRRCSSPPWWFLTSSVQIASLSISLSVFLSSFFDLLLLLLLSVLWMTIRATWSTKEIEIEQFVFAPPPPPLLHHQQQLTYASPVPLQS